MTTRSPRATGTCILLLTLLLLGGCALARTQETPRPWVELPDAEQDAVIFGITLPWPR